MSLIKSPDVVHTQLGNCPEIWRVFKFSRYHKLLNMELTAMSTNYILFPRIESNISILMLQAMMRGRHHRVYAWCVPEEERQEDRPDQTAHLQDVDQSGELREDRDPARLCFLQLVQKTVPSFDGVHRSRRETRFDFEEVQLRLRRTNVRAPKSAGPHACAAVLGARLDGRQYLRFKS